MSIDLQTIKLGETVYDGITYDIFADITNAPPAVELNPQTVAEITDIARGLFKEHAKAWEGGSLSGKVVVLSNQGATVDGELQKHIDLPEVDMPRGPQRVQKIWNLVKKEIVTHVTETSVARFTGYYNSIALTTNPDDEMQKLIAHLRKDAKDHDANILEAIREEHRKGESLEDCFKNAYKRKIKT